MRIAVLVAFNQITNESKPIASGVPSEMKDLAKQYALGNKKAKGFNQVKYFEQTYRTWKISKKAEAPKENAEKTTGKK